MEKKYVSLTGFISFNHTGISLTFCTTQYVRWKALE